MTGLDPRQDIILEVAAMVTDFDMKTVAAYQSAIGRSEAELERCNEWSRRQHTVSGLFERIRLDGKPEHVAASELRALIQQQFMGEPAVLAGNSVHQDRAFIRAWWPDVDALLHYRMLDVSSLKVYMQGKYGVQFEKKEAHRALDDIHESIAEWQYYLDWLEHRRA